MVHHKEPSDQPHNVVDTLGDITQLLETADFKCLAWALCCLQCLPRRTANMPGNMHQGHVPVDTSRYKLVELGRVGRLLSGSWSVWVDAYPMSLEG